MRLCTIGHSIGELTPFVEFVRDAGVEIVVDVRSKPRSRVAHFDQYPLQEAIEATGMRYHFMGDNLGGMPRDPEIAQRWRQGHLDPRIVAHLRETEEWQDGIAALVSLIKRTDGAVCIMCSEANVAECHRKAVALDAAAAIEGLELDHLTMGESPSQEVGVQEVLL